MKASLYVCQASVNNVVHIQWTVGFWCEGQHICSTEDTMPITPGDCGWFS